MPILLQPESPFLAYGEGDFNSYWLLALLLITFINWVATQLKRRQALKRGEPFEYDPDDFAPYLERKERTDVPEVPTARSRESAPGDEIRDFFASLTGQVKAEAPLKPKPTPPPVPRQPAPAARGTAPTAARKTGEAAPNAYLQRLASERKAPTQAEKEAADRYQRQFGSRATKARSPRNRDRALSPTALLREPGSLRAAFVLREILGPPKGLQSDHDAPTL